MTFENAPQLVQNDPVVAENDHFDDRVLTEQHRPEQEEKVSGCGPKTGSENFENPTPRKFLVIENRSVLLGEHPVVKVIVLSDYWFVSDKLWRVIKCH